MTQKQGCKMEEIQALGINQKSTLFDQFERLSVEIQLNQAMLRRSLSEPGSSLFPPRPMGFGPPLVPQPVEQGKRSSASSWGLQKMVKSLLKKPMFRRKKEKKKEEDDHHQQKGENANTSKDVKYWKRFSKSVRL